MGLEWHGTGWISGLGMPEGLDWGMFLASSDEAAEVLVGLAGISMATFLALFKASSSKVAISSSLGRFWDPSWVGGRI